MKIKINDELKIVSLWLGNDEINEKNFEEIDEKIDEYKKQKYKICLYQSGVEDIKKNVLDLIINNA